MSWKTAPRADLLARFADLGGYLVEAAAHISVSLFISILYFYLQVKKSAFLFDLT